MTRHINPFKTILALAGSLLLLVSCDSMNDIQEKYASQEERIYLAKVDPLRFHPGLGRTKVVWANGVDPRVESTVIYWNDRADSAVVPLNRTALQVQIDSLIVENLPEGNYLFEFRATNKRGESSLVTAMSTTVWGQNYIDSELVPRSIISNAYNFPMSQFVLSLSPCESGDNVVYSMIEYVDKNGNLRQVKVGRGTNTVTLEDYPDGGELSLFSSFFVEPGLDSLRSDAVTLSAPQAYHSSGKKLEIGDGLNSKYYDRDGELYEWTSEGNFRIYKVSEDGVFTLDKTTQVLAYRDMYNEFFPYSGDRFIIVTTQGGNLTMFSVTVGDDGTVGLDTIKSGFGGGFVFDYFIVMNGYFYSLNSIEGGSLLYWPVDTGANWQSGLGASRSSDFHYPLFTPWLKESLLVVDNDGTLFNIPAASDGTLGSATSVGYGWDKFAKIFSVGDWLLGIDPEGNIYEFDFDLDHFWVVD